MKKGVLNQITVTKNMCWRKMNIQMKERNKERRHKFWRIIQIVSTNWSPEFFRRDLWYQSRPSVCPSVHNVFSPSRMSQIFWNLVYSLSGVKERECPSLFYDFRKIRTWRAKKRPFLALFFPFLQFFGLKHFLESRFF